MKKKTFNKAIFLFLALALMLTPLNLGVFATENETTEVSATDESCIEETIELEIEQPIVTMATGCVSHYWEYSSTIATGIQCGYRLSNGGTCYAYTSLIVETCKYCGATRSGTTCPNAHAHN